jgi:hypothetical protein
VKFNPFAPDDTADDVKRVFDGIELRSRRARVVCCQADVGTFHFLTTV